MISDIGPLSLDLAICVAIGGMLASFISARRQSLVWLRVARWSIGGIAALFTIASAALLIAFLNNQFQFEAVLAYSERALPAGYKLAAFWAGQEGSLLLWAWMLGILCFIAVIGLRRQTGTDHAITVGTLAAICGFFAVLLVFAADPFKIVDGPVALDGRGLNPMLQDPGMIIHPPLLFLGYAGFTIPFAIMVGVLVARRTDNHWLALIRRWLLVSWFFLTAGIVIGAWWAYIELGWGGYWAWDPVENASLLPWLTATALIHSIMVQQHRGMFKIWNASLIALTFLLCIFGTYLTRSGVIESVHAFNASQLGTFFLIFLILSSVFSFGLIVWRRKDLRPEHKLEGLISREGAFLLGNVLLVTMMLTTLVGTIFPILSGIVMTDPVTVGQPFYNIIVAPMGLLLVALMAVGPVLAFGREAALKIARNLRIPAIASLIVTGLVGFFITTNGWALLCTAICVLGTSAVIVNFVTTTGSRRRSTGEGFLAASIRLIDKDHRRYGGQLAHLGVMMLVIGIVGSSLFDSERVFKLQAGQTVAFSGRTLTLISLEERRDVNFTAVEATITLTEANGKVFTLRPQRRFYDTWNDQPNSEVAILSSWKEDVYVSLAGWEDRGTVTAIQVRLNPLVPWIWFGGIVMGAGCLFSLAPRLLPQALRVKRTQSVDSARTEAVQPATCSTTLQTESSS